MVFLIGKSEGHLCFKWFHWWIGEELHLAPWIRENFTHTDQTVQSHTWLSRGLTLRWSMTIYWCSSSNKAAEVLIQLNLHPVWLYTSDRPGVMIRTHCRTTQIIWIRENPKAGLCSENLCLSKPEQRETKSFEEPNSRRAEVRTRNTDGSFLV